MNQPEVTVGSSQIPFALFEFLDDTHKRIHSKLIRLREIIETPHFPALKQDEKLTLESICRFFDKEAREHHLDEELHVFPVLHASHDAGVRDLANQLQLDHGWLEENWLELSPQLKAVINQNSWFDETEIAHGLNVFEMLYAEHMQLEETLAYPNARLSVTEWDPATIGQEMIKRRKHLPEKLKTDLTKVC